MATARRSVVAAAMLFTASALGACGGISADEGGGSDSGAVLMLPGTRGDGGFFDQSVAGVERGAKEVGWDSQVVEAGYEPTKWQPALADVANGGADVILTGSFAMKELVEMTAAEYPDKEFVLYDVEADLEACDCSNIYSITYRYDETGFLAGAFAGLLEQTGSDIDRINDQQVVGVVGGQEIPVIQDYVEGFKAGVAYVDPSIEVLAAYAGSFDDPVKGKAIATDMTSQGADVVFSAAGGTDQGVFEAAADANVWALGNLEMQADSPTVNGVDTVLTSSDTSTAASLEDAVKRAANGNLPLGETRSFGVKDGSSRIIATDLYRNVVPADVRDEMAQIQKQLGAGQIETGLEN